MAINFSNLAGIQQGNTASRPQSPVVGLLYYNTELNYFESYSLNGWFPIAAPPTPPTSIVATNNGSGRAYDNGSASVAFTASTTGGSPTSFIVRPSPTTSPATFTGATSPVTVTNLASSTQYTYTVIASSPYGNSSESTASSAVTATTVPQAPTIGAVTGGNVSATVAYTAGATGGASATFTATSSPGSLTGTGASPITVSGLTNGTAYTFTVTATNANGTSAASAASSSVTPGVSGAWESIATLTGGAPNISFTSIPSTYKHLQIRYTCQSNRPDPSGFGSLIFNGDSSASYSSHAMGWDNETGGSVPYTYGVGSTGTGFPTWYMGSQSSSSPATMVWDILDYTNTNKYKVIRSKHSMSNGQSGASRRSDIALMGGYWRNTSAINTITFTGGYAVSNLTGTFALYGIKG
jgi:hypothetical protein